MKNIAIVYDRELDVGGVESHLLSLFRHIDQQSYKYCVIAPASARFQAKGNALGVNFIPLPPFRPVDLGAVHLLRRAFQKQAVALVHVHSPTAAIPARAAARLLGLATVVTVHLPAIHYYGQRPTMRAAFGRSLYINIDRLMNYTMTDRLVYVSEQVCRECIELKLTPPNRSQVIPNGIALEKFTGDDSRRAIRQAVGVPDTARVITFVGRLDYQKGLDILLEALATLKEQFGSYMYVWLVGGGPLADNLMRQASSTGLSEVVRFAGYQEGVSNYLLASDLFVLPSRFEAMPIVILEALAAGLPCVVTDVGDNARLVENELQGLVVKPNDVPALANALRRLFENDELRIEMGIRARQKALRFDERQMTKQVELLYDELLAG